MSSLRSSAHPNLPSAHLLPDNTRCNTWRFDISSSFPFQICFNTIQVASQHTWTEDGYLNCPHPLNIGGDIWLDRWLVCGQTLGLADLWHVYLDKKLGKMGKNAIQFNHHGRRRHHTAAMEPNSQQQSIQQSTNMICDRSTSLKLEKYIYLLLLIWLSLHVALTTRTRQRSPPSHCCLPCNAASLASIASSCPLQRFLAHLPRVSHDVSLPMSLALSGPLHHRLASLASLCVGNEDDPDQE